MYQIIYLSAYIVFGLVFAIIFYLRNHEEYVEALEDENIGPDNFYYKKGLRSAMTISLFIVTISWPLYFFYVAYKEFINIFREN